MSGDLDTVSEQLDKYESKYRLSANNWKRGYRTLLILSAMLSVLAAISVQTVGVKYYIFHIQISSIFSGAAAVVTTIIAALDFETNWKVNRRSRHEVDILKLESKKSDADADKLLSDLQDVVRRRNEGLTKQD